MAKRAVAVVVLAAGQGTRMKSRLPKVLHPVAGLPMVRHVLDAAATLKPDRVVVVTGRGRMPLPLRWPRQRWQCRIRRRAPAMR